ncbi:spore germination protein GerPC [Ferroacidibacillus organovorans]|uniref:spore germination protein GerPC n=1 Tax=Ferroacidibacillus organovorans TaxID=1765683 RepID=UPI0015C4D62A|nr:spore germination protein GerPC [Ferroacidibacillus organovorans]
MGERVHPSEWEDVRQIYDDRLRALEREIETLKDVIRRMRYQKVEYRIDSLHVERLEGVLHIGLTTEDSERAWCEGVFDQSENQPPDRDQANGQTEEGMD